jgi:hypothetical protein
VRHEFRGEESAMRVTRFLFFFMIVVIVLTVVLTGWAMTP